MRVKSRNKRGIKLELILAIQVAILLVIIMSVFVMQRAVPQIDVNLKLIGTSSTSRTPTSPGIVQSTAVSSRTVQVHSEVKRFFDLVNQYRVENGLQPLKGSVQLTNMASWMASDMATDNYWPDPTFCGQFGLSAHCDNTPRDIWQRFNDFSYTYNTWKGENLGRGSGDAQAMLDNLKGSPGHNANLLNPNFVAVGVSMIYNPNSASGWYWAQDFGGYLEEEAVYTSCSNICIPGARQCSSNIIQECRDTNADGCGDSWVNIQTCTTNSGYCSGDNYCTRNRGCSNGACYDNADTCNPDCSSWANTQCGGGGCGAHTMYQTRNCANNCASESQCSGSCNSQPSLTIQGPNLVPVSTQTSFHATATDADDDAMNYAFSWGDGTSASANNIAQNVKTSKSHSWSATGTYNVVITASDSFGGSRSSAITVVVYQPSAAIEKGDVDCDGSINSVDALLILRFVAYLTPGTATCTSGSVYMPGADVDSNSVVNSIDALYILRYVAQLPSPLNNFANSGSTEALDSDSDLLTDAQELQYSCMNRFVKDATNDPDGDSLTGQINVRMDNIVETILESNPCKADSDNDGFKDGAELYIGTDINYPCGTDGWPADLYSAGTSYNKIDIQDLTSFLAPVRRLDNSIGSANYDRRWDLVPGKGLFATDINIQDLTALITLSPPMLNGQKAFNGPQCPQAP